MVRRLRPARITHWDRKSGGALDLGGVKYLLGLLRSQRSSEHLGIVKFRMRRRLYEIVPALVAQVVVRTAQTHMSWTSEVHFSTSVTSYSKVGLGSTPFLPASFSF